MKNKINKGWENIKPLPRAWKSESKTLTVRIPSEFKDKVLEFAHQLDNNEPFVTRDDKFFELLNKYKGRAKSTRNWVEFNRFINELES